MTGDRIALQELIGKSANADFLREMFGFAAQRLMELEGESLCGTGYGERSGERLIKCNGYRERAWEMRVDAIDPRIPKLCRGSYFPAILEPGHPPADNAHGLRWQNVVGHSILFW